MFRFATIGFALALTLAGTAANAATTVTELVTNGTFSSYTTKNGKSDQMSEDGSYGTQYVTGWTNTPTSCTLSGCDLSGTTAGYNFLVTSASAATTANGINTNDNGTMSLWGNNGFTGSNQIGGSGGAFIAADGAYEQSLIIQTISGLTVGQKYQLTFNYAGAQQQGYNGTTTEAWTAVFVDTNNLNNIQTYTTPTLNDAEHGFTGWKAASVIFTASNTSEILGFIAKGTPDGQPPFSLLDDVSLKAYTPAAVPEPASWMMMIVGFGGLGVTLRRKRSLEQLVDPAQ